MNLLLLAFSFLTTFPVSIRRPPRPGDLGRAGVWFPFVGLVIGGLLAGIKIVADGIFSTLVSAVITVAAWALITGGLHLDGLADCCDGLLSVAPRQKRLEILADPRLGSFAVVGLILHLALKITALTALAGVKAFLPLLLAAGFSRWLILLIARQPPARPEGLGAAFASGLRRSHLLAAAILPLALVFAGGARAILAALAALLVALGIIRLARVRLGGVTGDVLGMGVELCEMAVLLVFAAQIPDYIPTLSG